MYIGPREIGRQYTTPLLQGTICMWCLTLQVPCSVALVRARALTAEQVVPSLQIDKNTAFML